jgi:hypothetical protein
VTDLSSIPEPEFVSWNRFARRMAISLTASTVLTIAVIVLGLGIDVNRPSGHRPEEFLDKLIGPGFKIGEWLLPGHDLFHLVFWIICTIVFNAMVIWTILSAWAWLRTRSLRRYKATS